MGRIKSEKKAPEIVEHVMRPFLQGLGDYFPIHLRIHRAHVVMLARQGLLSVEEGSEILSVLDQLAQAGLEGMGLHPDTDLYMQMEGFVRERAPVAGGKMHMGRSRNDLYACAARMMTREKLAVLIDSVLQLQSVLLKQAQRHAGTAMPGYTHLQHAEPVTFGHFLLAVHDALARDVGRLAAAYDSTNRNPLGAAALAGSSLPLDREHTAALLGFAGLVENTYDAVAARDYILEAGSAAAIVASTVARVVDTFIVWSTTEFGMIDMPDSYAYTSSIMPQKRNPGYFFESVRAKVGRALADLMGAFVTLKGTSFMQSRETSFEVTVPVFRAFTETRASVEVLRGAVSDMIVRADRMAQNCANEFAGATEIANFLVSDRHFDFRSAYQVVATMVRLALERGVHPSDVGAELLDEAARAELGRNAGLSDHQVRQALDPASNVNLKISTGAPSLVEVSRMLKERKRHLKAHQEGQRQRLRRLADADDQLGAAVRASVAGRHA